MVTLAQTCRHAAIRLQAWLKPAPPPEVLALPVPVLEIPPIKVQGAQSGWLRVLNAKQLLECIPTQKPLEQMWRQSRLSLPVWERDLLAAIHRYAEFVQLMPASESHHHAHVGGLLSHTLETLLAAMTWRNGHFLPEGATVEAMDAQRDEWTYVVFFGALLHDIAKPMTDLRVLWRNKDMAEPIKWAPVAGSLLQVTQAREDGEYLVEFMPKSLRDYGAHSRMALTLLQQIAPPSALSFLSRQPHTLDVLSQYLCGQDKTGLVAKIVQRADQASAKRALLSGSKARFTTANTTPLIELLMTAIRSMLAGTTLPLNRSGAAGWVYDGSVWFVAKRLADGVRAYLQKHAPDEGIPGESKNDRLFDTWQEYGCITLNPHSGQAVWYVNIQGQGADAEEGGVQPGAAYSHALTVLRFPLDKLYDDPSHYPPAMLGRIEVKTKRDQVGETEAQEIQLSGHTDAAMDVLETTTRSLDAALGGMRVDPNADAGDSPLPVKTSTADAGKDVRKPKAESLLKAPNFNKPLKPAKAAAIVGKPDAGAGEQTQEAAAPPIAVQAQGKLVHTVPVFPPLALDGFEFDGQDFLDDDDDAKTARPKAQAPVQVAVIARTAQPTSTKKLPQSTADAAPKQPDTASILQPKNSVLRQCPPKPVPKEPPMAVPVPAPTAASTQAFFKPLLAPLSMARTAPESGTTPAPIVLMPHLPKLPHENPAHEPSEVAIAFITWLQGAMARREVKYNETGAAVHFVPEGMALISPLIFKLYAKHADEDADVDITGLQVQREVIKAGWHMMGPNKVNILRYSVLGRGGGVVAKLSTVVLVAPDRWVMPVPPSNPVLVLA